MFLSVIVCTRNRAESLRQTVDSLFSAQNLEVPGWEVLVIESSGDHTADVCQEFQKQFPQHFRFLKEKKLGKSQALNTGIAAAKGEILAFIDIGIAKAAGKVVAFIDDDVICAPEYVRAIQAAFSTYSTDAVAGRVFLDCEGGYPEWLGTGDLAQMADLQDFGDEAKEWKGTLCGTNMVVRADVFRRSGGFALELGPGPNTVGMWEDTEASIRMRQAGCRMMYVPEVLVRHQWQKGRLTKAFIRSRFVGYGRAHAYYEPLPASFFRFGLYVLKEAVVGELVALSYLCAGHPAKALMRQSKPRSYAGLLWQHWLFRKGVPRRLSTSLPLTQPTEKSDSATGTYGASLEVTGVRRSN